MIIQEMRKPDEEFNYHLGLLGEIHKKNSDSKQQKLISFLAVNYLAKAAPIYLAGFPLGGQELKQMQSRFQIGLICPGLCYNRESRIYDGFIQKEIATELAESSNIFLLDTKKVDDLFSLSFSVMPMPLSDNLEDLIACWEKELVTLLTTHIESSTSSDSFFVKPLSPSILCNFSCFLDQLIVAGGDTQKVQKYKDRFCQLELALDKAIEMAATKVLQDRPEFFKNSDLQQLKVHLRCHISAICCSEIKGIGILSLLPLFCDPKFFINSKDEQKDSLLLHACRELSWGNLDAFLNETGIRLGAVNGRRKMFEFISLESFIGRSNGILPDYVSKGENIIYFKDKMKITETQVFQRLLKTWNHPNYIVVLGRSTLDLIQGLVKEISEDGWVAINHNSVTRQLVQTSLYRILQQLSSADAVLEDYSRFTQSIELIHYEIAALLTLFSPFKEKDFSIIQIDCLKEIIPDKFKKHMKGGITRSAMNTYAGIRCAANKGKKHLEQVFDKDSHFELAQFIGLNRSINQIIKDPKMLGIDLYLGEFNPNIGFDPYQKEYKSGDPIAEIELLLEKKTETKELTVAIDCTIDLIASKRVSKILEHFEKAIDAGKLNFIFFRSGQKFDMFGMDHYYGSPFYMINNGDKKWNIYDSLLNSETYKTDPLTIQWFCLAYKYASNALDKYRSLIFNNTKSILKQIPKSLRFEESTMKIIPFADDVDPCFIDVKCFGKDSYTQILNMERLLYKKFLGKGLRIHTRGGYGYFDTNINLYFKGPYQSLEYATMRINPGLADQDVATLSEFFQDF